VDLGIAREAAADAGTHGKELAAALDAERGAQTELTQHVAAMEARLREALGAGSETEAAMHDQV